MRITVFGNCQTPVISDFMGLQCPQAEMIPCPRVHLVPRDAPEEVFAGLSPQDCVARLETDTGDYQPSAQAAIPC